MAGRVDDVAMTDSSLLEVVSIVKGQSNVPDSLPPSAYAYRLGRINGYICGLQDAMRCLSAEGDTRPKETL